jgi:DNA helicase HerA-like ATPase
MGPLLLARLMGLNDTQASVLQILFRIADDAGLLLLDLKDIDALIRSVQENLDKFKAQYGHLSPASLGAIQRSLLSLDQSGVRPFFGEPALDIEDLLRTHPQGQGYVHILAADQLLLSPMVYSTLLLWLLSELFEKLPEVGDPEKPKLVFFFDEAHLLFKEAPKALVDKIEQVVRLVRSKGVGVYFVTQSPRDVPDSVLGQLSHRVQHALRAFTPVDRKAVKVAAETLRANPAFSAEQAITQLEVGEALVSVLDAKGAPTVVERAFILPPASRIGPISPQERQAVMRQSPVHGHYEQAVDRESAYEILQARRAAGPETKDSGAAPVPASSTATAGSVLQEILFGSVGPRGGRKPGLVEKVATSATRSMASSFGREIVRGILGSMLGGSRRKR